MLYVFICTAGNWRKGQDNLNPIYYEAFADYLTEVVLQYQKWGLHFDTLEFLNAFNGKGTNLTFNPAISPITMYPKIHYCLLTYFLSAFL
jgi:hypothetical protein